tara:strand:+ start:226 stop:546 length:321 start_codon:yes stop_codon:yes gene_type:complete
VQEFGVDNKMSISILSVLETVKILKLESEQITKKLDLLIVHLVENQDKKIDDIYKQYVINEKIEMLQQNQKEQIRFNHESKMIDDLETKKKKEKLEKNLKKLVEDF